MFCGESGWLDSPVGCSPGWVIASACHAPRRGGARRRSFPRKDESVTTWPAAVLFDMDGTLIESHANVERAWATWAAQRDLDVQAVLAMAHGLPADVTAAHWFPEASADEVLALSAEQLRLQYEDVEGIDSIEGVTELLEFLDDTELPWAIYTSADAELARVRLRSAGLKPRVLVTRDQVEHGKPAPDGYLRAARLLAVPADQCIVIEDTDVGLAAGRAAGMTTVGVRGVVGDLPVRSISELHLWLAVKTAPTTLNGPDLPLPGD